MSATSFGPKQSQHGARLEWFSPAFESAAKHSTGEGFTIPNQIWPSGGLTVTRVPALAARSVRARPNSQHGPAHHWVLTYYRKNVPGADTLSAETAGNAAFGRLSGKMVTSERNDIEWAQLFLPRDAFGDLAPLLDAACWSVLDTPLGHLLGDFMLALDRRLTAMSEADRSRLNRAVGALVAACVAPSVQRVADARNQIDAIRMERVRQAVQARLRSSTLNPATLCRAVGISRSSLYRLFDGQGGAARFIQEQRLIAAHAALCDIAARQPIYAIATEFCFADASTFSRAFRQEFGHSPSEVRAAALIGQAPPAISHRHPLADTMCLGAGGA